MSTPLRMEFIRHEFKKEGKDNVAAFYKMSKPSDLPPANRRSQLPIVRLHLKEKGNEFQLEVMHKVNHRYILRLEAIKEIEVAGQSVLAVFVEPHSGPLIACLESILADTTLAIPSQALRELIRQMIVALEVLRQNGLYHGDFTVYNIYYSKENHVVTIKLANFRRKPEGISLEAAQLRDWIGLGYVLAYISNGAKSLNGRFSCSVIDHLASKLQALTDIASLPNLKSDIFSDPFFWDRRGRTNFYINNIPKALTDPTFIRSVEEYGGWVLPWTTNPHNGLIAAMNAHRRDVLHLKTDYDGTDPVANLKCMSGAYTHQDDLEGKIVDARGNRMSVDAAVHINQPDLTLIVYKLMTGEIAAEEAAAAAAAEAAAAAGALQ